MEEYLVGVILSLHFAFLEGAEKSGCLVTSKGIVSFMIPNCSNSLLVKVSNNYDRWRSLSVKPEVTDSTR